MSLCKYVDVVGGQLFELVPLFYSLTQYCSQQIKPKGCISPEDCGIDVVTRYIFEQRLRGEGRCEIYEDTILIKIPGAISQEKVLRALLCYEIRNKKSRCKDCQYLCQIADEAEERQAGQCLSSKILIDPVTPETTLGSKELIETYLAPIEDPQTKKAFIKYLNGSSYKAIAADLGVNPSTARQRIARTKKLLRQLFPKHFGDREK